MDQIEATPQPYRYVVLGMLGISNLFSFMLITTLGVLLPSISHDLGLTPSQQGWLGSSALFANLIFSVPMSVFLTRFNAKILISVSLLIGTGFIFLQGWAPVFAVLLLGRFLFGMVVLAREPARTMLFTQWFPPKEMMIANSLYSATFGLAITTGFLLTPFLLVWFNDSWRMALTVYGFIFIAITVAWQLLGRQRTTAEYRKWEGSRARPPLRNVLRYSDIWYVGIGMMGVSINWNAMITFWPTLMLEEYDMPLTTSGSIQAISGVVGAVGGIVAAMYIVKRDIRKPVVAISGLLTVLSSIGMVSTGSVPLLVLLLLVNGLGSLFYPVIMTVPFELPGIKPREIAVAAAVIMMCAWAGGVVGPVTAGFLQEATGDLAVSLVITSLFGLTMVGTGFMISRPQPRQVAVSLD